MCITVCVYLLVIISGGSVGDKDHAISTEVTGKINVTAGEGNDDQIHISAKGDLNYDVMKGGESIGFTALGGIYKGTSVLKAESIILNALGGSLGSKENPIITDTAHLSGMAMDGDINLENLRSVEIDNLNTDRTANLKVNGNITATPKVEGQSNISAKKLVISANGNVGDNVNPLSVNTDNLTIAGRNISIQAIKDVMIDKITGNNIQISGDGNITGNPETKGNHIIGNSLTMKTFGKIGEPLRVNVATVNISTDYGTINIKNSYQPYKDTFGHGSPEVEEEEDVEEALGIIPKTGDSSAYELYLMWMALMVMALVILRKKRKVN